MKPLPFFLSPDFILNPPAVMVLCGIVAMWLMAVPDKPSRRRWVSGFTLMALGFAYFVGACIYLKT